MESLKLTVAGYVQKVGYRQVVERIARELGITGYVKNLEDDSVEIIAQHKDKGVLEKFSEAININRYPVEVKEIKKETVEADGYELFKIIRGEPMEELGERMDVAGTILYSMDKKLDKVNNNLGGKIDKMSDNLDGFASAVSQRFDVVDTKYGKISEKLEKLDGIDDSLKELVSILRAFKPKE